MEKFRREGKGKSLCPDRERRGYLGSDRDVRHRKPGGMREGVRGSAALVQQILEPGGTEALQEANRLGLIDDVARLSQPR